VITLFCVRPRGFNIGNDAIFLGLRQLLRETLPEPFNIVQVAAAATGESGALCGLLPKSIHEMNLYGNGVVVGGGNVYENGGLDVDVHALAALRPPLMLFSLSYGRVYDHRHRLVPRTDAMPAPVVLALNARAAVSTARDEATLAYLTALGISSVALGGCPSMLVSRVPLPAAVPDRDRSSGTLLSIRNPELMSIPLRDQARLHHTVPEIIGMLEDTGFGPVRVLCHDTRDVRFAAALVDREVIVPDDVYSCLDLLRRARLVVSFRLHAFVPCLSLGTPAINLSYDERSRSLVRTLGFESWDVDFVGDPDPVAACRDRCGRLEEFAALRDRARAGWQRLEMVQRQAVERFATQVAEYERS
jgi:hypothetical protein